MTVVLEQRYGKGWRVLARFNTGSDEVIIPWTKYYGGGSLRLRPIKENESNE